MTGSGGKISTSVKWTDLYRKYGIFLIAILLFIVACFLNPNFIKPQNLINIVKQITPFTIIAMAETMLIVSGQIDLSAGAVAALAGCISAGMLVSTHNLFFSILAAMAVGIVSSYVCGILVTVFRLPAFIATLAIMNVARGAVIIYTGGATISGLSQLFWLSQGRLFGFFPNMILIMIIMLIIIQIVMKNTRFGLYMYAVGGNTKAAITAGINVNRQIRMTYLLGGVLVGIAGVMLNARMMAGHPNVGPGYEFDAITATVVGGTSFSGGFGSMYCVVLGGVIIGIINNLMILMGVDTSWQMVVKGILIAMAVALDIMTKGNKKSV
jgi:inositol transport system permease protein